MAAINDYLRLANTRTLVRSRAMRRFERMLARPVEIWEVELSGSELRSRTGIKGGELTDHVEQLGSAAEAAARLETEIAAKKQLGFVEIRRVAAAETPVHRQELIDWEEKDQRHLYQLEQRDRVVTVRDPRDPITAATSTTHPTIAAASAAYDREADKYRKLSTTVEQRAETNVQARHAAGESFDARLEEDCLTSNDPKAWSVLADLLQERDHPAGKLAAAFDMAKVEAELPKSDEFEIVGGHAHGFVRRLHFERTSSGEADTHCLGKLVEQCLDLPILRMTHVLSFGVEHTIDNSWTSTLRAVANSPLRRVVRELHFDAWGTAWWEGSKHCYGHDRSHEECQGYGDFSELLEQLPLLDRLEIWSGGSGGTLGEGTHLPRLRVLARHSKGLRPDELLEIAALEVPALESLELTFGKREGRVIDELATLCKELRAPKLTHLALRECREAGALLQVLVKSKLVKQLRTLDLAGTRVGDALANHAAALGHLARIEVTAPSARVRKALPNVVDARPPDGGDDAD